MKMLIKRTAGLPLLLMLMLLLSSSAFADTPDEVPYRGVAASAGTLLDRGSYADGERYEPESTGLETVKVGLSYGNGCVDCAYFANYTGSGFELGYFDEDRIFHSEMQTPCTGIAVYYDWEGNIEVADDWYWNYIYQAPTDRPLAVMPSGTETPITYYNDTTYYGGFEIKSDGWGLLQVVNFVPLEDYVRGVLPNEMMASWPIEALKAQAVCARTYAVNCIDSFPEYGFDVTDTTESQVYRGTYGISEETDRAVRETEGLFVRYEGEICTVYYFASDGGATESGGNVFDCDEPYLRGKTDPFEDAVDYSGRNWYAGRDAGEIEWYLQRAGHDIGYIVSVVPEYSENGNVIAMTYTDEYGSSLRLTQRDSYALLGMNNCRFRIEQDWDWFNFYGSGWGHNCGMSQWGAYAMAEVYGYNFEDIIRFYFTGTYIA